MSDPIETSTETTTKIDALAEQLEDLARQGIGLGRLWASHGLTIGQLALEHGARTLDTSASTLNKLSQAVGGLSETE